LSFSALEEEGEMKEKKTITRRDFLVVAGIGGGVGLGLVAGGFTLAEKNMWPFTSRKAGTRISFPHAASTGRVKEYTFEVVPTTIMIGARQVTTWAYNGAIPGPEVHIMEGDTLRVTVKNRLQNNEGTSTHWHGVPLVNSMDGVPGATQQAIARGQDFVYEFVAPTAGTYFYHSHVGLQLDRGLYGALIIESAREQKNYDQDVALVLDDWLDGMPGTPDDAMKKLIAGGDRMKMGAMGMSAMNLPPDLVYPTYLINGKPAEQPMEVNVKKGQKIRLRFINAAASTIFHVALQGHQMTVTYTDGQPVEPVEVDAIRIGMGERYDVLVTANNPGIWQLAASVEGAAPLVRAVFRYQGSTGQMPTATFAPPELKGKMLQYAMLKAAAYSVVPPVDTPDLVVPLQLSGGNGQYVWKINGQVFDQADIITIPKASLISFQYQNTSMMTHPMHLHGHFFQLENGTGRGPLKDTVLVNPMQNITTNWVSDNPGTWAYHCHNAYHQMTGMMRFVKVS
jgi:FtsP/CotA-like multicopper oxidase with cupredoxin domain